MQSVYNSKATFDEEAKKNQKLPRKCVVIKRTYLEEGIEKTELRYVSYKKATDKLDKSDFFEEVSQFFKGQVEDMETTNDLNTNNLSMTSELPLESLSSTHKINCTNEEMLKKAIPSVEYLLQHYTQMAKKSNDAHYTTLKRVADGVLTDMRKALTKEGVVDKELLDRVRMFNIQISDSELGD